MKKKAQTKLIIVMILLISLFGIFVLADLIPDNAKEYNSTTNTFIIKDKDTNLIIEAQRLTSQINYIFRSASKEKKDWRAIACYNAKDFDSTYKNVFSGMEFYNIKETNELTAGNNFEREYEWRYKNLINNENRTIYGTPICKETFNETNGTIEYYDCSDNITGYLIIPNYEYISFKELSEISKGDEFCLFTYVIPDEHGEYVPEFAGVIVEEDAEWEESMNSGLIAYYSFEETTGSNLPDEVGNGSRNGTLQNMENDDWNVDGGILGNSLVFGGSDEYVNMPYLLSEGGNGTISFWIKKYVPSLISLMGRDDAGVNAGDWHYNQNVDGTIYYFYQDASNHEVTSNDAIINGTWAHIIVMWGTGGLKMYLNGTLQTDTDASIQAPTREPDWGLGAHKKDANVFCWIGELDEVGIWDRRLDATEISNLWNNGIGITYKTDFTAPTFVIIPANKSIIYGTDLCAEFEGADETAFDSYAINFTTLFQIDQIGNLTNSSILAVGTYLINVTINDTSNNLNWTIWQVEVNKSNDTCLIETNANSPIEYGQNLTVSGDCTTAFILYKNGSVISNNSTFELGAGTYNFTITRNDTANYTNIYHEVTFVVSKGTDNCTIDLNVVSPIFYETTLIVKGDCNTAFTLYRNNTVIADNSTQNISAGVYNFTIIRNDTANYTNVYDEETFQINKTIGEVYLYLDGVRQNITIYEGSSIFFNATLNVGNGLIELYYNLTLKNNETSPLYRYATYNDVGKFNVTATYRGNDNYTIDTELLWLTVAKVHYYGGGVDRGLIEEIKLDYPKNIRYNQTFKIKIEVFDIDGNYYDPLPQAMYVKLPRHDNFSVIHSPLNRIDIGKYEKEITIMSLVPDLTPFMLNFEIVARGKTKTFNEEANILLSNDENVYKRIISIFEEEKILFLLLFIGGCLIVLTIFRKGKRTPIIIKKK